MYIIIIVLICIASHRFINWIKDAGFWDIKKLENDHERGLQEGKGKKFVSIQL